MKHNVAFELDLTNPTEANIYNAIRNLDGIKNAVATFKSYLEERINEIKGKGGEDSISQVLLIPELEEINNAFQKSFSDNGVNV